MLNIVVPMAGRGSRFANKGYILPKPLIEIHHIPMIAYVVKNVTPACEHRFVFICLKEHIDRYDLIGKLNKYAPGCRIVTVDGVTDGAACTVLLAEEYIDNDDRMMIVNSDQFIDIDINDYLSVMDSVDSDGLIMTMEANDDKWSFVRYNEDGLVTEVREKEVISDQATTGIYNFRQGKDFVCYAKKMIEADDRVNGEFYAAPVYNYMIKDGKLVNYYDIGSLNSKMYGLGVPDDLNKFLVNPLSFKWKEILLKDETKGI